MSTHHTEEYRRETAALPADRQLSMLREAWRYAVQGQREMGFSWETIISGLAGFVAELQLTKQQRGSDTVQ